MQLTLSQEEIDRLREFPVLAEVARNLLARIAVWCSHNGPYVHEMDTSRSVNNFFRVLVAFPEVHEDRRRHNLELMGRDRLIAVATTQHVKDGYTTMCKAMRDSSSIIRLDRYAMPEQDFPPYYLNELLDNFEHNRSKS